MVDEEGVEELAAIAMGQVAFVQLHAAVGEVEVLLYHAVAGAVAVGIAYVALVAAGIAGYVEQGCGEGGAYAGAELAELYIGTELFNDMYEAVALLVAGAHLRGYAGGGLAVKVEREVHGVVGHVGYGGCGMHIATKGVEPCLVVLQEAPLAEGIDAVLIVIVPLQLFYLLFIDIGEVGVIEIGAVEYGAVFNTSIEEVFFEPVLFVHGVEAEGYLYIATAARTAVELEVVFEFEFGGFFHQYALQAFEGLEFIGVVESAEDDLRAAEGVGECAVGFVVMEMLGDSKLPDACEE